MAVAFESISSIATGSDDSVETTAPSGVVSGDLLICAVRTATSTDPTTPDGWNLIAAWTNWFGGNDSALFWRIADGTSDDTPVITIGSGEWYAVIARFSGHHATTPIDNFWTNDGENSSGSGFTIDDILIAEDGSVCFAGAMTTLSGTSLTTDLTADGYTIRASKSDSAAGIGMWTGAFDASTDGGASGDVGSRHAAFVVAIKPAAGGGGAVATKRLTLLGAG